MATGSVRAGLPFYYNRKTGRIVCGATTYENLENWATGQSHSLTQAPPISQEEVEVKGRVTGSKARMARLANKDPNAVPRESMGLESEAQSPPMPVTRTMPSAGATAARPPSSS